MSARGVPELAQELFGHPIVPGTLNLRLTQIFDVPLTNYLSFAEFGIEINFAELGIDYDGEAGLRFGRIVIADRYPGFVICPTWVEYPSYYVELVSNYHLRSTLGLQDGDTIEFTLVED
jgi:CTP-dependent riboflavin kinase